MNSLLKYLISLIFVLPFLPNDLITMLPVTLTAEPEIFGYYENEIDQARFAGSEYSFGYNKVRLDMESSEWEMVTFRGNFNIQLFNGRNKWDLLDFLPARIVDEFDVYGVNEFPFLLQDTLYLDNAYFKMVFPKFDLTIGKQQLSFGSGYAWNPLDIFNRIQLLDPTYEQTGVNAFRVEIPVTDRLMLDAILSPGDDWESSSRFIQGKIGLGHFDLTATMGSFQWERTGLDLITFQPEQSRADRQMVGGAFVGEVAELGIWSEGSWNKMNKGDDFAEYLIGLDHTFDFSTYILAEFYHNGSGAANRDSLRFNDYLSYFSGETHSLMQDYLFVFVNHPATDLMNIGLFGIANLNDESAVINPQIEYNVFESVTFTLLYSYYVGDNESEFGIQDWGIRLRLRGYF